MSWVYKNPFASFPPLPQLFSLSNVDFVCLEDKLILREDGTTAGWNKMPSVACSRKWFSAGMTKYKGEDTIVQSERHKWKKTLKKVLGRISSGISFWYIEQLPYWVKQLQCLRYPYTFQAMKTLLRKQKKLMREGLCCFFTSHLCRDGIQHQFCMAVLLFLLFRFYGDTKFRIFFSLYSPALCGASI